MADFRGSSPSSDILSDGMDSLSMRDKALLKRSVSKHHNNNFKAGYVPVHEQYLKKTGLRGRKTFAFWTLVGLLFILAVGNLILTMTILGVLRLGQGMQSLELVPEEGTVKFYGNTDLGHVYKRDGKIESFLDEAIEISSYNSTIVLNMSWKNDRPVNKFKMNVNGTSFNRFDTFEVKNKEGVKIFSTNTPSYNVIKNINNLSTKLAETNRIVSPFNGNLKVDSKNVNLHGAEGTNLESREILWSADQDIYLKSVNGSLILSGKEGVHLDMTRIPIAVPKNDNYVSQQNKAVLNYKVCVCMPQGKLFRVPVPNAPNTRTYCNHINMLPQHNPCL